MKSIMIRSLIFPFFLISSISAQETQPSFEYTESEVDRTSDQIEQFVDEIVQRVESALDEFIKNREQYSSRKIEAGEQDKEKLNRDALTFNGDTDIAENDTVHGDLVVKNGMLTVRGTIMGDVLVVNGDVHIKNSARIAGNVRAMNGIIKKSDGAVVQGFTEESKKNPKSDRKKTSRARYSYTFKPNTWYDMEGTDNFLFRYNRVEGFFFGFGSAKEYYWDGSRSLSGFGSFGYGFASHKWRLQLGLDRQFATSSGLYEFGGEAHSLTDTKDEWIMNLSENNLASLFFHEDFRDYYQREGFSIHTGRYTKDGDVSTLLDARYNVDRYTSLNQNAHWSLFGGRVFRSNPAVSEGMLRSVSLLAGVSTVEKYRRTMQGWDIFVKAEYAGNELGGDFSFTHTIFDIRRYQSISDYDRVNARVRIGSLEGMQITQRMFELGGANMMPAYGFKEFAGNRMILGNIEYQLNGEVLDWIFLWPDFIDVILFGDAGAVISAPSKFALYEGFDGITSSTFKSDIGFALSSHSGDARLGFAWRTDKSAPVAIFLRLNRAF